MLCRVYEGPSAIGVRDWLEQNGIHAFYRPDGVQRDGHYSLGSVWVIRGDEERALSLLVFEPGPQVPVETNDRCPQCGQSATHCWCASEAA